MKVTDRAIRIGLRAAIALYVAILVFGVARFIVSQWPPDPPTASRFSE